MSFVGIEATLVHLGGRRAALLDAAVRRAGDVRGDVALRPRLGGSGLRSRRLALAGDPLGRHSDPRARPRRGGAVRFHAFLRRVRPHAADRGLAQHAAARNLEHDAQRHLAVALCARHGHDDHLVRHHRRLPRHHRAYRRSGAPAASRPIEGGPHGIGTGPYRTCWRRQDLRRLRQRGRRRQSQNSRTAPIAACSAHRAAARPRSCA